MSPELPLDLSPGFYIAPFLILIVLAVIAVVAAIFLVKVIRKGRK